MCFIFTRLKANLYCIHHIYINSVLPAVALMVKQWKTLSKYDVKGEVYLRDEIR